MRLLVATTNTGKLREIRSVLGEVPVELVTLRDLPTIEEPEETGLTFEDNARLKALYYSERSGMTTVAEDSGLVIDGLDGEPGVRSARFLRPDASYTERFAEIFHRLSGPPEKNRAARFVCALAVADRGHVIYEARGTVEGEIAREPRGTAGFGYDPIFYYPPYGATLAEVGEDAKLAVAHRGQAFRALTSWISSLPTSR
ncbi:MAG TPA: RdgB/HAM1 family non-canonical purine NTP pyrophosphatase [Vicinamibacterales bacterium]